MKRSIIILLIVILCLVIGGIIFGVYYKSLGKNQTSSNSGPTINITYQNLASELSKTSIVKAIPKDSSIALKIGEKEYILENDGIREGKIDSDITITLPGKYIEGLTNKNLCSVIQKANNNGDLGFDTTLSKVSLAWKFKSMYNYRSCFGF